MDRSGLHKLAVAIHLSKRNAKTEVDDALARHIGILNSVTQWCVTSNTTKEQFYYLLAPPIIYSAWEGYFRVVCSICLRRLCGHRKKKKKYNHQYTALWLQRESFTTSFFSNLFNSMTLGKDSSEINKGKFKALSKFSGDINAWLEHPIDHTVNFDDLVMTYSNVNKEVVTLNSGIIGIDISTVNFSRLNDLVGRRNDISHGGFVTYPNEDEIKELVVYAESLINSFHTCVVTWIKTT